MISIWRDGAYDRPDIRGAVMFVVPQKITGDTNFARRVTCRFDAHIRRPNKSGESLKADVVAIKGVLGSRRDFANNWRRIADSRGMIKWLFEKLKMPVVEIHAAAIR